MAIADMKYCLRIDPTDDPIGSDDNNYYLTEELEEAFDRYQDLGNGLTVYERGDPGEWMTFCFMEWAMSSGDSELRAHMMTSTGPTGVLRECRHSYFGPEFEGYIFYLNGKHMKAAIEHLEQYYDLD